jgi:hypothetical protein
MIDYCTGCDPRFSRWARQPLCSRGIVSRVTRLQVLAGTAGFRLIPRILEVVCTL